MSGLSDANALVTLSVDDGIAQVRLNDPDRRNALSPELVDNLIAVIAKVDSDAAVRCAVLSANGTAFSAGGNPKRMLEPGLYQDMNLRELAEFYRHGIQRMPLAFAELQVPIIAAINGPAIGAGLDLACMCDMRVASEDAVFASSFVKLGLVPGDGGAWLLPRAVGAAHAAELLFTGDRIDAARAKEIGLVSRVVPADALDVEALELARRVAANPPHALRAAKVLVRQSAQATLYEALAAARTAQAAAHQTDDHREAVTAFLERRAPLFTGH